MLAGENFGEFGDLLWIHQSFICQLLVVSEKVIGAGLKFAKVFFAKYKLACNSPKFSPAKIFHYTVSARLNDAELTFSAVVHQVCQKWKLKWDKVNSFIA